MVYFWGVTTISRTQASKRGTAYKISSRSGKVSEEWLFTAFQNTKLGGIQLNVQVMGSKEEYVVFCRMCLHSSCCRRLCIPQTDFDKYMNKKLHKGCQTPRHYLWLRKFLSCRLDEIWEYTVRKHYSFLDDTLCPLLYSSSICYKPCLDTGCWAKWTDRLWLSWCSWCLWSHGADITCIWDCIDSVLHIFQGLQDLPLWQGHNT